MITNHKPDISSIEVPAFFLFKIVDLLLLMLGYRIGQYDMLAGGKMLYFFQALAMVFDHHGAKVLYSRVCSMRFRQPAQINFQHGSAGCIDKEVGIRFGKSDGVGRTFHSRLAVNTGGIGILGIFDSVGAAATAGGKEGKKCQAQAGKE